MLGHAKDLAEQGVDCFLCGTGAAYEFLLFLLGHFDDLVDVSVDVLLSGVEVADDYANAVVIMELSRRTETLFDIFYPFGYFFGQRGRHLPVFVLDLEEDYRIPERVDAE